MKSAREEMDIVNAYAELGSYRAAAAQCGTTHKTARRIISWNGVRLAAPDVASNAQ